MWMKTSCKFYRIPGTQSRVITKVHDLLGQPSYMSLCVFRNCLFDTARTLCSVCTVAQLICAIAFCISSRDHNVLYFKRTDFSFCKIFCCVDVALCDLVHDVETVFHFCFQLTAFRYLF